MVKKSALNKSRNRFQSNSFFNRLDRDTQRQVSYVTRRLERKMSNPNWTKHILTGFFNIKEAQLLSINKIQQYGLPKNGSYIIQMHDQIANYIKQNPNSRLGKQAQDIYNECARVTGKLVSKMERYNLHVPRTITQENPEYNGQRIHIKLEEVL